MKKVVRYTVLFMVTGVVLISCKGKKEEVKTPDTDSIEILPEVVFTVVDDEPLRYYIESRGVVEPTQKIEISPKISGFIEEHNVVSGKELNKGDLILQFDKEELENNVQEAENNYLQAKNEYETTIRSQKSYSGNFDDKLIRINTGLANAELVYERAKLNLKYTTIKAPFSGTVSTEEVISVGAYISAGKDLGSLLSTRKVRIRFDVLEKEVIQLNVGMDVEIKGPDNENHTGRIVAISPEIDKDSKTGQAIVELDNKAGIFKTGMTVEGRIFVRSTTAKVRMPRESLLARDGRTLVFKLNSGEVEWIYVTPQEMNTEWVLINHEEIEAGDTLAVDKHFSISHQQKVVPLMAN
jgi:RND family efflux transporter MFP subunit